MPLLRHDQILRLHEAIVSAGRASSRIALLGGLDARFVAELPSAPDPSSQILCDLTELNRIERLADGTVPLRRWLETAAHLAGPRVEAELFREALALLGTAEAALLIASARHQLRAVPADFTGREEELKDLTEKMGAGGAAISGLQGQGGISKTALALKLAAALAPRFPDAQIDIDLKGADAVSLSPSAVMAHVIHAFEPTAKLPEGEGELGGLYRSVLHGKRVLLFFDNARDRAQVEPLLPPTGCVVIVTSRQRFVLPGLYARILDELIPADAVALIQRIAPRVDARAAATIAELCGYLPLALRLAASALAEQADLEPDEYVERLRTAQGRVDLIAASLSLSFDLLDARLSALWPCLGVFPGDFDREAAAAVGALEPSVAREALRDLLKHSMVDYDDEAKRYRLHDLSRLDAVSRLGEADRYGAQRRHAEHFNGVVASTRELYEKGGTSITTGLALFDREWVNIQAGQAWAAAHAATDDAAAGLCSDFPTAGVYYLDLRQHPQERLRWREEALAAARRLGQRDAEGAHLGNLGLAYMALGEPRRAIELYEQDLLITREIGDRRGEGSALGNLGNAYAALGEPRRAIELYEQQLLITREIGDRRGEAIASWNLGLRYEALGELDKAITSMQVCVDFERAIGHPDVQKRAARVDALRARQKGRLIRER